MYKWGGGGVVCIPTFCDIDLAMIFYICITSV